MLAYTAPAAERQQEEPAAAGPLSMKGAYMWVEYQIYWVEWRSIVHYLISRRATTCQRFVHLPPTTFL